MTRVALTGGIATGKSHVRGQFATLGVPTVDADDLAREAVLPGTPALDAIVERFGPGILGRDGHLDRKALGARVFADPAARRALEHIVHPVVQAAVDAWFRALPPACDVAIAVIPLLYEAGREGDFDRVITTACERDTQRRRLMDRDGLSEAEAELRLDAQLSTPERVRRADYVISTDGTYLETEGQVRTVLERLRAR
jgi:dephospho-CoA kinase